jgi:hypothetical protein
VRVFIFITLLLTPVVAAAQSPYAPVIEVRTAAGFSNFLHGDIDGIAPSMRVAVRIGTGRFAIEPEVGLAWLEETETFSAGTTNTERTRFQSLGVNAIGRWPGHRVSPYLGAGLGMYTFRRRNETVTPSATFSREFNSPGDAGAQSFKDPGGGSVVQGFGGIAVRLW